MSKSKGEFVTVDSLLAKGYNPLVYRLFCLQSHYQKPLVFSYDRLNGAVSTYNKLKEKIASIQKEEQGELDKTKVEEYQQKFKYALEDNLNTSMALAILYDVLKQDLTPATKLALVADFDKVLALNLLNKGGEQSLPAEITALAEERWQARLAKDWAKSDELRNKLHELGYVVKDGKDGYSIRKK